jgi:hypothetical protein
MKKNTYIDVLVIRQRWLQMIQVFFVKCIPPTEKYHLLCLRFMGYVGKRNVLVTGARVPFHAHACLCFMGSCWENIMYY